MTAAASPIRSGRQHGFTYVSVVILVMIIGLVGAASLRLGVPCFPGDPMHMNGEVTAVDGATVTLRVQGRNSRGVHVTAEVVVEPYERKSR